MITLGSVLIGLVLIAVGFFMAWKGSRLRQWVGDISAILDVSWLDWPVLGIIVMLFGGLLVTGIFQSLAALLLGGFLGAGG